VLVRLPAIVDGLFMHGKGLFKDYPLDPESRRKNLGDGPATPVWHLMDPKVSRESGYSKVIIR